MLRSTHFYIDELFLRSAFQSQKSFHLFVVVVVVVVVVCLLTLVRSILFDFAQQIVHDAFVPVAFYTCNDVFINKIVAIYNSARRMVPVHTY